MKNCNRFKLIPGALVLFVLGALLFSGCGQTGNIDPGGDTDFVIDSIWADQTTIVAGNFTNVYVLVKGANTGEPVKNIPVSFTTNRDSIVSPEPITDDNGIASTTFMTEPDSSGAYVATITAIVSAEQERIARLNITILPTNFTNPGYLFLTAVPDTVYADGTSSVLLTASVVDSLYTPLQNKTVTFKFLQGNMGDLILDFEGGSPITDASGEVKATFIAPEDPRTVIVSASVAGTADSIADTATVWVLDIPDVSFIDLSATPTSIPADGASELTLSAYVTIGGTGAPAPDGTEIYFTSESGALLPYTGSKYSRGRIRPEKGDRLVSRVPMSHALSANTSPNSSITAFTESGYARVKLRSSTTAGRIECTATSFGVDDTLSDTTYVEFLSGSPYNVVVTAGRSEIMADGTDTTGIIATVYDEYGNEVGAGLSVDFSTDKGGVFPASALTDSLGNATTTLTSGTISGYATITATCQGASGYTQVLFTNTTPRHIQLTASPTTLPADGVSQSTITAEVLDSVYTPVTDGVRIKFYVNLGSLSGTGFDRATPLLASKSRNIYTVDYREAVTDDGFCSVVLTSGYVADSCMVASWYQYFDPDSADTVITAADTVYVPFLPGDPERIEVSFSRDSIRADQEDTCTVYADVYDAHDNLVGAGQTITFSPDVGGGTVNPESDNTNASGQAQTILTSSRVTGWHTITATSPGAMAGNGDIYFYPVNPQELRMLADFDSATADGADSVLIEVYVTDDEDNPCSDGIEVVFTTEEGTFLPYSSRLRPIPDSPLAKSTPRRMTADVANALTPRGRISPRAGGPDVSIPREYISPMEDTFTTTTIGGFARIYLIAPTTIGTTWVKATVAVSDTEDATDSMLVAFKPDIPRMIHLSAEPDTIPADSASTSRIAALVTDAHGNPVGDGVTVEFSMETGSEDMGYLLRLAVNTNTASACTTTFHSRYFTGEAVIKAALSVYPTVFNNIGVWLTGSPPGYLYLTADSTHLPLEGSMGVQAEVFDSSGSHISDGSAVEFTVQPEEMGDISPGLATTLDGFATSSFVAGTLSGEAYIIATSGSIADTSLVYIGAGPAGSVLLSLDSLRISTSSAMGVRAEVFDSIGYPISDGTPVRFDVYPPEIGTVVPPTVNTVDGEAIAEFRSDTTIGSALVVATVGAVADTKVVYVGSLPVESIFLSLDSTSVHIGNTINATATVYDSSGAPISDGTRVTMRVEPENMADMVPPRPSTLGGDAISEFRPDTVSGTCVVIATIGTIADTQTVRIKPGPVANIVLTANPDTLLSVGGEMSDVVAECFDAYGNHVEDGRDVTFDAIPDTMGAILSPVPTDSGFARTTFTSGTVVGRVVVRASIDDAVATVPIEIVSTEPAYVVLTSDSIKITVGTSTNLRASVFDATGRPISDDTRVDFTAARGEIDPPFAFTTDGYAVSELFATTVAMVDTVVASVSSGAIADTIFVHYVSDCPVYINIDSLVPDTVFADGSSRSRIFATVRDIYLNYARPGTPILLKANADIPIVPGFVTSPAVVDSSGHFVATYRASNDVGTAIMEAYFANGNRVDDDYGTWYMPFYPTYDINQITAVTIFEVEQIPPIASFINVTASPNRVQADGTSSSTVTVSVYDSTGAPVADGTIVNLYTQNVADSTPVGNVPSSAFTTDGIATATWTSPTYTADAFVYANIYGLTDSAKVEFIPGDPTDVSLEIVPDSLPADGLSRATATATVTDLYDNPVPGVNVDFAISPFGMVISPTGNTDSLGQVSTEIFSSEVGLATVAASILGGTYVEYGEIVFTPLVAAEIFMSADSAQLLADGLSTTMVRAMVLDSSSMAVPDNTPVRFTTDLGFVFPGVAYTDSGIATAQLRSATTVGTATITGDAGGGVTGNVEVDFVPGAPASIEVEALPTTIPANGDTFTQIHVTVYDVNDNTVAAGEPVTFTTTLGTIDTLAYTNSLGEATVYLYAGITPGTAVVWASSGAALGQTTVNFTNTNAANLYLYIDPNEVVANARDTARVWGRVTNDIGTPVSDDSPVILSVTTDSAGPYGAITPVTAHTDSGMFEAIFTADRNIGSAFVVADAGGVVESVMVDLLPGPPDSILVEPEDSILPADSFSTTDVHVEVFDRFANPVGAGVDVTFDANRGFVDPTLETTNSSGHADVIFIAGRNPGEARIRATAGDATGEAYIILENSATSYVTLTSDTSSLVADAISTTFLRADVRDSIGNPVSDGTPVYFSIDTITGSPSDTTMAIISPTLGFTTGGQAAVQVRSGIETGRVWFNGCTSDSVDTTCGSTFIDMVPGAVDSIYAWPEESTLVANGEDFTIIHAILYDRYDNPVGSGVNVDFTAAGATVSPEAGFTNSGGEVTTVLTAGTSPTLARVDITAEGIHAVVTVDIGISPPAYLSLRADPRSIAADGESNSTITARVLNELGQPVSDGQIVVFHSVDSTGAEFGSIDTLQTTTDGEAVVQLYSEPRTGTAFVSARVGTTLSDTVEVRFVPGPPHRVEVIPEYPILNADGVSTSACTIKVVDEYDNLVEAGTRVDITVGPSSELGSVVPPYVYTDNDAPSVVTFRAGVATGVAVISADVAGGPTGAGLIELRPLDVFDIDVFADSLTLTANGFNTTRVHASAINDSLSAVSDSTAISFYTSGGTMFPAVGYTSAGEAIVTLRSPSTANSEPDTIIAYVGDPWDPTDTMAVADTTYITFVPGPPHAIEVIPAQPSLIADGSDTCSVTAIVYDAQGNRVENGKIVRFESSLGLIDTLGVTVTDTSIDSTGMARVLLRSGTIPGTAVLTVTCEGAVGIGNIDFVPYGIEDVFVSVDPDIIPADRHSTATITGTVRDSLGNLIGYMTPVHLYPLPDPGGNNLGFIAPATVYTDSGYFTTEFTADTTAGICDIVAEVYVGGDTIADTTWIELVPGEPHIIDIWPTPGVIPADSFSTARCSVYVYDRYYNPMTAGTEVDLESSMGILSTTSDETNSSGLVIFDLMSTYDIGTARITARAGVARGDTFVEFTRSDSAVGDIAITVDDPVLQADGFSETTVRATVFDTAGSLVGDLTRVDFSMIPVDTLGASSDTFGNLIPQVGFTESGKATTTFRVKTVRGEVWIKGAVGAAVDSVRDSVLVQILPGDLSYITFEPDTDVIAANGRDNTRLTATLYDDFNNPLLSGNSVNFGTDLGTVGPTSSLTNSDGQAFTTLTAGTEPGIARVFAQSGSAFELAEVEIRESNVGYLLLTADPTSVIADGMSQSILTCQVYDTEGSPASDGTEVVFEVHPADTGGTVVSPKLTTGGACVTSFTSSTDVGYGEAWIVATVYAPSDTITDSVRIFIEPGPAAAIDVWADSSHVPPDTIWADGSDNIYMFARVADQYNNHLRAGNEVTFTTDRGTITPSAVTDTSGIAQAVLTSSMSPGNAVIIARSGSAVGYDQVNFRPTDVSNIIVYSDSSGITADGISRTAVRAYVYSTGGFLVSDETLVEFEVDSLAYAEPGEAYTDSGVATIFVRADTIAADEVQVRAIAGGDTGTVSIRLKPGPANRIIAYAEDSVLYADGASVTTVACTVYDRFSNPIFPGSPVTFETTLGSVIPNSFTNTSGYAFTRLTAGTDYGDALVTIRSGEAIQFVDVRFDSLIADEIIVTVNPAILPGDGTSTARVRAWVYAGGLLVSDGTRVSFDQDTSGGRITGIITPRIAFTEAGTVGVQLTAPIGVGQGRIIGNVGATVADTFDVTYEPGEPSIIVFDTLLPSTLPADGAGYPVIVYVYDEYGNPVDIGTEVTFETSLGDIITPVAVDSASGSARTLVSSTVTGPAFITARSGGAVASKPYEFTALDADEISLVANPISINADGVSTSSLVATVFNIDSLGRIRPVSDNTPVTFQSIGSGIVTPTTAYTEDGQVNATLFASVVTGYDTVIATVDSATADTAVVKFTPGPPAIVNFIPPIRDMNADGADTQQVTVEVTDAFGNPVRAGLPVSFDISIGFITPNSATDSLGMASAVIVSGSEFGTASISATCEGASGFATLNFLPLEADTLSLVVDPPILTADGSDMAELTAVVFDSAGLPVSDGTIVKFTTSAGITNPVVAYTSGGIATSSLTSGTTPNDSVFVVASAGTSAVDTSIVSFVPGPPAVMYISASDSAIVANGADSTTIFVEVSDAYGNPVGTGVEVSFSASLGEIVPTAFTDTSGRARVRLLAGTVAGFSNITATAGAANASMLIEFVPTNVGEVLLTVIPSRLTADGVSTANVNCFVLDTLGVPVSDGTPVRFGELGLGSITPLFATTLDGEVTAEITAYTTTGWDTLVATSGGIEDTVGIEFISGPPYLVRMWPADTTLLANETDTTRIYGRVYDEVGNPVNAGKIVNLSIDPAGYGTITPVTATDDTGAFSVRFRAGRYAGVAVINGDCEGATGITQVELMPTTVDNISLSISSRYMDADGISSTDVTAYVTDSTGFEIADGTIVRFAQLVPPGNIEALIVPNRQNTTDGQATVSLSAPTVAGSTFVYAYIPLGTGDTVSSDTQSVYFNPGDVAVIRFDTSFVELVANGSDTLVDSAWVEDAFGNPIPDAAVNFSIGLGEVSPPVAVADGNGGVRFKITAPNSVGSSFLTATSGGATGYLPIDFVPDTVDTIILSVTPRGLPADGASSADVRALVLDDEGNPIADGVTVRFTAGLGVITPFDNLEGGIATAILTAADTSGTDTIRATCLSETSFVLVNYDAGPPDDIEMTVIPDTATVGSTTPSVVSGTVLDASDNPVAAGTYVYLSVDSAGTGSIADPIIAVDDSGQFSTFYTPGLKAGLTGVTATSGDASAHQDVLLKAGPPHTMNISVSRDFIYIRGVGEIDQSVIQAVIYDQYDNPVRDSSEVVFEIVEYPTGGSIDPELIPGGGLVSSSVYTIDGSASVTLRSGDRSGSIVVQATAGALDSRAPRITVGSGLPYNVSVSIGECNVAGWLTDGVSNSVTAIVTDEYDNPVAPGTAVWFSALQGAVTTSSVTNDSGFAFATWYSSDPRSNSVVLPAPWGNEDGLVTIIAETRDTSMTRADTVQFYNSGPATTIDVSASPGVTEADTSGHSDINVTLEDVNGHPVVDSTMVELLTTWGSVVSPVYSTNECLGSYAVSRYSGRNLNEDDECGNPRGGVSYITANAGLAVDSDSIILNHGAPRAANSQITAPGEAPWNYNYIVGFQVLDIYGNPICGEDVRLTPAIAALVDPAVQTSGIAGECAWELTAPDSTEPALDVLSFEILSTGGVKSTSVTYTSGRRRPYYGPEESDTMEIPMEAEEPEIGFFRREED